MKELFEAIAQEWTTFAYWKYLVSMSISFIAISLVSIIASSVLAKRGETKMRITGFVFAFITAVAMIGVHQLALSETPALRSLLIIAAPAIAVLIIVQAFNAMIRSTQRKADWSLKSCLKVKAAALEKFEQFDKDQDGDLSQKDIITSMASGPISREDQFTLQYLLDHLENIGHKVGSVERVVFIPVPAMRIAVVPTKMQVPVYAIGKHDLERWPSKVKRSWENWSVIG